MGKPSGPKPGGTPWDGSGSVACPLRGSLHRPPGSGSEERQIGCALHERLRRRGDAVGYRMRLNDPRTHSLAARLFFVVHLAGFCPAQERVDLEQAPAPAGGGTPARSRWTPARRPAATADISPPTALAAHWSRRPPTPRSLPTATPGSLKRCGCICAPSRWLSDGRHATFRESPKMSFPRSLTECCPNENTESPFEFRNEIRRGRSACPGSAVFQSVVREMVRRRVIIIDSTSKTRRFFASVGPERPYCPGPPGDPWTSAGRESKG